jgi:cellulose synthase (UDP-forming)
MPLCIVLLGITPVRLTQAAVLELLLPLWIALLLSVGWLNRGSRHALLADLPGWALAVPLAATVVASLWGRVQPFRITPKHRLQGHGGIAPVLALPLVVLLGLNGLNLAMILRHLATEPGNNAAAGLGLLWGSLTLLGLLVALRACQDPPASDPTPWLGLATAATLTLRDARNQPHTWPVQVWALSEVGAALQDPPTLPEGWRLERLQLLGSGASHLPALPLEPQAPSPARLLWARDEAARSARIQLVDWLYGRPGAWPERAAPPEWRALLALMVRLLRPPRGPRLSLVPQQLEPPAQGRCAAGNRSGKLPASAS